MRKAIVILLSVMALILSAPVSAQFIPGGGGGGGGGGSGTVTNVATGACLTGGPITTTGTVSGTYVINAQTGTTYTVLSTDACALVTLSNASAIAVTLPQATGSFAAGFGFDVQNKGVGLVTITPTTSTINGLSTLTLATNQGCTIVSDGTNWQVSSCTGPAITWNQQQTFASVLGKEDDQSGTTYTLVAADCGKTVAFSNGSAVTVTIPAAIVPAAGTFCDIKIRQDGAGQVSVNGSAVSAATLVSAHSYTKTFGANAIIGLELTTISATTTAVLTGDGA